MCASLGGSSEQKRKAEPDARCGGAGSPHDAGGRPGFVGAAFAQTFFEHKLLVHLIQRC